MSKKELNILILGETGVGKSTFINAFSNYINFPTLDGALDAKTIQIVIPSKFTITDESFQTRTIETRNKDENESSDSGQSSTQECRSYLFEMDNVIIRLIDTPGIGDTRGVEQDKKNFENIMCYLREFSEINAIIIMLKPNDARLTVLFEYCIKQLFASLERSAIDNIMFLFTNSRATFYNPGDTAAPLKAILKEIKETPPNMDIRFGKENTFCLDNEGFRFLLATREGCNFPDRVKQSFYDSWDISVSTSKRLLECAEKLRPHKIQNTVSVMDARRSIEFLRVPLSEITILIENNLSLLARAEEELKNTHKSIDDLKTNLMISKMCFDVQEFDYPRTVCMDCAEPVNICGFTKNHFKRVCHDHCYLKGVPSQLVGDWRLQGCATMVKRGNKIICEKPWCGHLYNVHQHVYYTTKAYEKKIVDTDTLIKLNTKKDREEYLKQELERCQNEKAKYENEKMIVQKAVAKFAHFLSMSVILPFNDAYDDYLQYLIEKERSLGDLANKKVIESYEILIKNYVDEQAILMEELRKAQEKESHIKCMVSVLEIRKIVDDLYRLELVGKSIKKMYDAQQKHLRNEIVKNTEKIIKPIQTNNEFWKFFGLN